MTPYVFACFFICAALIVKAESEYPANLCDLTNSAIPCSAVRDQVEVLPRNLDIVLYFYDRYVDGSYVFGYILGNGERRYERGTLYEGKLWVEGFYSFRKVVNSKYVYETTRYYAGKDGYRPSRVEITFTPPKIPTAEDYRRYILGEMDG